MRAPAVIRLATGMIAGAVTLCAETSGEVRLRSAVEALRSPETSAPETRLIRDELEAVVAAAPDAEAGITARYLLGRLRQLEADVGEPPEFTALLERHPGHPLAQLARVKVILWRLYAVDATPPAERLAAAEQMGAELTLPAMRGDFHLAMGEAYLFHGDRQAPALRHLRAAEQLGIPGAATRANVLVQIGELARLTGDRAGARRSYQAFLTEYPRDLRQQIVRDRLAALGEAAP